MSKLALRSNPPAAPPTSRRRRQGTRPGASLLAQGEPFVWLTGGALALALSMIFGLLALVLASGGGTFWPQPVARVSLADGRQIAGELTREDEQRVDAALLTRLAEPAASRAREMLGDRDELLVTRRYYRTGNFELTNEHYAWVADFERDSATPIEFDPWMIVVERETWGRFYGVLDRYERVVRRAVEAREQDLAGTVSFLELHAERLGEGEREAVLKSVETLRGAWTELRTRAVADLVRRVCGETAWPLGEPAETSASKTAQSAPDGPRYEFILEDESAAPFDSSAPLERVVGVRLIWSEPAQAWSEFQRAQVDVRRRLEQAKRLSRDEIGALGERIEKQRLAVRRGELSTDERFVDEATEIASVREELAAGRAELERYVDFARCCERELKANDPASVAIRRIGEELEREWREQMQTQTERERELAERAELLTSRLSGPVRDYLAVRVEMAGQILELQRQIAELEQANAGNSLWLVPAGGEPTSIPAANVVRAYPANRLAWTDKTRLYVDRWWEFLSDTPREANSEGGVFPAIFGTVAMTLVMSLAVVPFGVLAALYLREYARGGLIVSLLRIAINNLAGVPSIVFGVFGFGFFCYLVGAYLDGGPRNTGIEPWAPYRWYLGLFCLACLAVAAFVVSVFSVRLAPTGSLRGVWFGRLSVTLWIGSTLLLVWLIFVTPFFGGFFSASLPNPTYGKGGLLWSALTLALLTLPVVIVSTEESLAAVPNSMREGSYACGAGKWQTIRRIVLPQALPGIMTGMILAMARGAGEVAPLMLVGAVKLAPELPVDSHFPFVHPERSFLHLGFHIFDLGFQSQNSEAAKPMVFTTTLLLIVLIASLNLFAVWLRGRLRRRFQTGQF